MILIRCHRAKVSEPSGATRGTSHAVLIACSATTSPDKVEIASCREHTHLTPYQRQQKHTTLALRQRAFFKGLLVFVITRSRTPGSNKGAFFIYRYLACFFSPLLYTSARRVFFFFLRCVPFIPTADSSILRRFPRPFGKENNLRPGKFRFGCSQKRLGWQNPYQFPGRALATSGMGMGCSVAARHS